MVAIWMQGAMTWIRGAIKIQVQDAADFCIQGAITWIQGAVDMWI